MRWRVAAVWCSSWCGDLRRYGPSSCGTRWPTMYCAWLHCARRSRRCERGNKTGKRGGQEASEVARGCPGDEPTDSGEYVQNTERRPSRSAWSRSWVQTPQAAPTPENDSFTDSELEPLGRQQVGALGKLGVSISPRSYSASRRGRPPTPRGRVGRRAGCGFRDVIQTSQIPSRIRNVPFDRRPRIRNVPFDRRRGDPLPGMIRQPIMAFHRHCREGAGKPSRTEAVHRAMPLVAGP